MNSRDQSDQNDLSRYPYYPNSPQYFQSPTNAQYQANFPSQAQAYPVANGIYYSYPPQPQQQPLINNQQQQQQQQVQFYPTSDNTNINSITRPTSPYTYPPNVAGQMIPTYQADPRNRPFSPYVQSCPTAVYSPVHNMISPGHQISEPVSGALPTAYSPKFQPTTSLHRNVFDSSRLLNNVRMSILNSGQYRNFFEYEEQTMLEISSRAFDFMFPTSPHFSDFLDQIMAICCEVLDMSAEKIMRMPSKSAKAGLPSLYFEKKQFHHFQALAIKRLDFPPLQDSDSLIRYKHRFREIKSDKKNKVNKKSKKAHGDSGHNKKGKHLSDKEECKTSDSKSAKSKTYVIMTLENILQHSFMMLVNYSYFLLSLEAL
ncbi:MAG: hypothetical protein MHMPM18_003121 [Marteilia pararefringens]